MIPDNPKVSIMISVYNQLHCLEKALQSALDQTYENLEIVIADDCSNDGDVEEFVRKYADKRIKYFKNQVNLGISGNYKKMLRLYATGDLALMLNADDYLIDDNFIRQGVAMFLQHQDIALVFGDVKILIKGSEEFISDLCNKELPEIFDGNNFFLNYWKGYSLPHLACLYDRKHAISLGFYDSESISSDLESLFKLIMNKKVGYINHPIGVLVRHNQNITKSVSSFFKEPATNFIEQPYRYAINNTSLDRGLLDLWRTKMLKRYYFKNLVKLQYLSPERIPEYKAFINQNHPEIYRVVVKDIRYRIFRLIFKMPGLLRFIFKSVIRQESFIADLLSFKQGKAEAHA